MLVFVLKTTIITEDLQRFGSVIILKIMWTNLVQYILVDPEIIVIIIVILSNKCTTFHKIYL